MHPDELKVRMFLKKKPLQRADAEAIVRKFKRNHNGIAKGKQRKRNTKMVAYHCSYCGQYHVGHDNFDGQYDPAYTFRRQGI